MHYKSTSNISVQKRWRERKNSTAIAGMAAEKIWTMTTITKRTTGVLKTIRTMDYRKRVAVEISTRAVRQSAWKKAAHAASKRSQSLAWRESSTGNRCIETKTSRIAECSGS